MVLAPANTFSEALKITFCTALATAAGSFALRRRTDDCEKVPPTALAPASLKVMPVYSLAPMMDTA